MPRSPAEPPTKGRAGGGAKKAKPAKASSPAIAFPKKNQPPTAAAFAALLPLALGKRLESARAFLGKQKGVSEDLYFYGPRSGWGLRYLLEGRPVCTLFVHGDAPLAIVALDAVSSGRIDWKALSPAGQKARKSAHGSPALLWLDLPLLGTGAADLKILLKAKLETLRAPSPQGSAHGQTDEEGDENQDEEPDGDEDDSDDSDDSDD